MGRSDELTYQQRPFIGAGQGLQVSLEQEWLNKNWDWYVGVKGGNISQQEIRTILQMGKLKLNWKMGSASKVALIFRYGMPGITMQALEQTPRVLPPQQGWVYYAVDKDPENAAWKDVLVEQTLGLHFTTEIIGNLNSLTGQTQLEVIQPDKRVVLEFALFAVPHGSSSS